MAKNPQTDQSGGRVPDIIEEPVRVIGTPRRSAAPTRAKKTPARKKKSGKSRAR
jgi:hypothetical protein